MKQIVKPRTGVTDGAGWCHRMARAVFNAPLVYGLDTATKAADATKYRHTTRKMPNVAVPVWFWHYGTYGGVTGEFGHVVVWVPGRGFLTSPWYLAHGQEWYSTLEEVERRFNSKYRFWSEDINGLRVAEPKQKSKPVIPEEEDEDMAESHSMEATLNGKVTQCIYDRDGFITEWVGGNKTYNANIRKQHGVKTLHCSVSESHYNAIKRSVLAKSQTNVKLEIPTIPVLPEKTA